ncbi:MAG: SDR family NAD(P)-dependent oxidoreductase [Candidatus Babeliales bacterium]
MQNKKVLVTGGAGFIGSHVVKQLLARGAHVTVLDNLSTGSLENLQKVKHNITFLQGDIRNFQDCLQACREHSIIFHLAAKISVPESTKHPEECYDTNIIGTLHMLEAARQKNVERFIFSSSAAVYGVQEEICHENMRCMPSSPYGHSKLIGEQLCKDFWQTHSLETVCLRYFNVFGAGQNPHGSYAAVVAAFTECMRTNKPITLFGDGLQTRDFIAVEKVAAANIDCALAAKDRVAGQVFNIATGSSITLLALVEQLKQKFPDYKQPILFEPARAGDIKHSRASVKKYENLI